MSLICENTNDCDTDQLSNYLIEKSVGFGSFGKVQMATHIPTQEKVAIKIIETNTTKNSFTALSEISILKKISHPNILEIYDIINTSTNYYIISEFISGGELFSYIQKKSRLAQNDIAFLFFQIINAIDYLHKNNIVHRDLKPENILLTKEKIIKIIDFGLAKDVTDKNIFLKTKCGSLCYSAPEMLKGEKYNGKLVDIWSIGVILFIMSSGTYPFEDKNEDILIQKIVKGKINYPHYVPFIIKNLLQKILVVNPKNRITIKELKEHSLYKHGKSLFLKDNVIYDSSNFLIRKDILQKAKDMINKENKNDDIISNKILIDKIIKSTNWRLFLSTVNLNENDFNKLHNKKESQSSCIKLEMNKKLTKKPKIKMKELNFYDHFPISSYRKHAFGTLNAKIPTQRKTFQITNNHSFSSGILSLQAREKMQSNQNTSSMNEMPLKISGSHPVRRYINLQNFKDNTIIKNKKENYSIKSKHQEVARKILKNTQNIQTKIISIKFVNQNSISASFNENTPPKKSLLSQRYSNIKSHNKETTGVFGVSPFESNNRNIKQIKITNKDNKNKMTLSSADLQKIK